MSRTIAVDCHGKEHVIDNRPLTMVYGDHDHMDVGPMEYFIETDDGKRHKVLRLTADDTRYHGIRVKKLHDLTPMWYAYILDKDYEDLRKKLGKGAPELRRAVQDVVTRGEISDAILEYTTRLNNPEYRGKFQDVHNHVLGFVDMALKFKDQGILVAWVKPETYLHPDRQSEMGDFLLYIAKELASK